MVGIFDLMKIIGMISTAPPIASAIKATDGETDTFSFQPAVNGFHSPDCGLPAIASAGASEASLFSHTAGSHRFKQVVNHQEESAQEQ